MFGWFIVAIAALMSVGIYVAYRKGHGIRIKYVISVIVMFIVGVKWLLEN